MRIVTSSRGGRGLYRPERSFAVGRLGRTVLVVAALMVVALSASFFAGRSAASVVRQGTYGPVSTTPGTARLAGLPGAARGRPTAIDIHFSFRADELVAGQTIFELGTPTRGLAASVSSNINGQQYVVLSDRVPGQQVLRLMLVSPVRAGTTYSIRLSMETGGGSVAAWVDGARDFSYPLVVPAPPSTLGTIRVGTGTAPATSFAGSVTGFRVTYRQFGSIHPDTLQKALWLLAGTLFATLVILTIIRTAGSPWALGTFGLSGERPRLFPRARVQIARYSLLVGVAALVGGIALLCIVTPIDNTVLQREGSQVVRSSGAAPGKSSMLDLGDEPRIMSRAAALDVDVSFLVRPQGRAQTKTSAMLVSTLDKKQGILFQLTPTDGLIATLAGESGIVSQASYPLLSTLPTGRWTRVAVHVQRSQSYTFFIDGHPLQSFTWALPIIRPTPADLAIAAPAGISLRDASVSVTLYRHPLNRLSYFLVRLAQGIGIALIVIGVLLVSRRLFSRLVPLVTSASIPLTRVVFLTAGLGIVVNVGIDLLHIQHSSDAYLSRNSWMVPQYPRFTDFFQTFDIFRSLDPYGVQSGSYPPFGYWLTSPLSWMHQYTSLLIFLAIVLGFMIWWFARSFTNNLPTFEKYLVVIVALLSLPVSFAVDRANIDLIIFIFVLFGVAAFETRRPALSSGWLALAAAAKGYPALYLLMFLRGRRLRYLGIAVAIAFVVTIAALYGFDGSLVNNIDGLRKAEGALQTQFSQSVVTSTYYNASLVGWAQSVGFFLNGAQGAISVQHAIKPFIIPFDAVGALGLIAYVRWRETSLWRTVSLVTILSLLLVELSNYYELLFLFIPLALFLRYGRPDRLGISIAVLFGLLLAPKAYFYLGNLVDSSVLFTAPLLVALATMIILDGKASRQRGIPILDAVVLS